MADPVECSIVVTGRNDNWGGDFTMRLIRALRFNATALLEQGASFEVILVEWNPVIDRPLLSDVVREELEHMLAGELTQCLSAHPMHQFAEDFEVHIRVNEFRARLGRAGIPDPARAQLAGARLAADHDLAAAVAGCRDVRVAHTAARLLGALRGAHGFVVAQGRLRPAAACRRGKRRARHRGAEAVGVRPTDFFGPLNMASLTFGHMIRSARPLVGADQWNELMLNFDVKSFDREATQLHFNRLHDIVEDVVGSFASDDMESAALGGQLLLASAIDGYLAAYGLTNPRPKWRICKLRAEPLLGDLVLQAYRQFEFGDMSAVLSGQARGLVQRLEFARFLQLATVMPSVCAGSLRDLCNSRNPKYAHPSYAMASMLGDDFVISNPGPRCRVGRFDLLVWLLWPYCDTSATIRRLMGEAASHYETTDRRFSGDVAGAIELSIAKLSKLSLFDIKA